MPCPTNVSLDPSNMIPPLPLRGIRFHNESVQGTKTAANRKLTLPKKKKKSSTTFHPETYYGDISIFSFLKSLYIFSFSDLKILVAEFQFKFHIMGKNISNYYIWTSYILYQRSAAAHRQTTGSVLSLKSRSLLTEEHA